MGLRRGWRAVLSWLGASDPGFLRLQLAGRTVVTLMVALAVLFALARATGQPFTAALLGVVVAMMSAMAVNDPDPQQQRRTLALLPVPAAAAVALGAVLAPYRVWGDAIFVLVMFGAAYARRFGGRGTALGMVALMSYFFALFLGATVDELPALIGAVVVGTVCSFAMRTVVWPDRPQRVLERTLTALLSRAASIVELVAASLRNEAADDRWRQRLTKGVQRLNQTALMVQGQLDDKVDPTVLSPAVGLDELALRVFDLQLTSEWLARAASATSDDVRADPGFSSPLADALDVLRVTLHRPTAAESMLDDVEHRLADLRGGSADEDANQDAEPAQSEQRALLWAVGAVTWAARRLRTVTESGTAPVAQQGDRAAATTGSLRRRRAESGPVVEPHADQAVPETAPGGLLSSTRQAIQVAVAGTLAMIAGELLSPTRWYWAVITAFVVFTGTKSREETLTKGWQRLAGTCAGIPVGIALAALVGGHTAWSIALIFASLFAGFYLLQVSYSLMIFCITTMLALLYGVLGHFSVSVLLTRLEETAAGAVIGVAVALFVLPASTTAAVASDAAAYLSGLASLVEDAVANLLGDEPRRALLGRSRELDRQFNQLRTSAKPRTQGISGLGNGRNGARHMVRVLAACDHYGRALARAADEPQPGLGKSAQTAIRQAASRTQHNLLALRELFAGGERLVVCPAATLYASAAEAAATAGTGVAARRIQTTLDALEHLDQAVVNLADDLGAPSADQPRTAISASEGSAASD